MNNKGFPSHQLATRIHPFSIISTPMDNPTSRAPHKAKATSEDGTDGSIINCGVILIGNQGGGHLFSIYMYVCIFIDHSWVIHTNANILNIDLM